MVRDLSVLLPSRVTAAQDEAPLEHSPRPLFHDWTAAHAS